MPINNYIIATEPIGKENARIAQEWWNNNHGGKINFIQDFQFNHRENTMVKRFCQEKLNNQEVFDAKRRGPSKTYSRTDFKFKR